MEKYVLNKRNKAKAQKEKKKKQLNKMETGNIAGKGFKVMVRRKLTKFKSR